MMDAARHTWRLWDEVVAEEGRRLPSVIARAVKQRVEALTDDLAAKLYESLDRLRTMHQSYQELTTGVAYDSPWPALGQ